MDDLTANELVALKARVERLENTNPLMSASIDSGGRLTVNSQGEFVIESGGKLTSRGSTDLAWVTVDAIESRGQSVTRGITFAYGDISARADLSVAKQTTLRGKTLLTGIPKRESLSGLRALAVTSAGEIVSVPFGSGGFSGPIGTKFMWPFPENRVTSDYGPRPGIGKGFHDGIDFGMPTGTPIPAIGDGVVTSAWIHSDAGPYAIDIDHGSGFHSQYWHCSARWVTAGQHVQMGQHIGAVGNLGLSYGAHLHLEIIGPGSPSGRYSWPWRAFYQKYGNGGL